MPFNYTPYESPYTGAIADLIAKRGDIAAQAAQNRAAARVSMVENLANAASGALRDYAKYQEQAPARELAQLQLGAARRASQNELDAEAAKRFVGSEIISALNKSNVAPALKTPAFTTDERGMPVYNPTFDENKQQATTAPSSPYISNDNGFPQINLQAALGAISKKFPGQVDAFLPLMQNMNVAMQQMAVAKQQALVHAADMYRLSNHDPDLAKQTVALLKESGSIPQETANFLTQNIEAGRYDLIDKYATGVGTKQPIVMVKPGEVPMVQNGNALQPVNVGGAGLPQAPRTTLPGTYSLNGEDNITLERDPNNPLKVYRLGSQTPLSDEQLKSATQTKTVPLGDRLNEIRARLLQGDPSVSAKERAMVLADQQEKDRASSLIGARQAAAADRAAETQRINTGLNRLDKAYQEGAEKLASVEGVEDVLNSARTGNKVAQVTLPMMAAFGLGNMQGMHRFNKAEFQMISGAGSLWDKIRGGISGLTVGQPIPPSVLNDMEQFVGIMKSRVEAETQDRIKTIKKTWGLPNETSEGADTGAADFIFDQSTNSLVDASGRNQFGTPRVKIAPGGVNGRR